MLFPGVPSNELSCLHCSLHLLLDRAICNIQDPNSESQLVRISTTEVRWKSDLQVDSLSNVLVAQSYLTLCDAMDCSPPGSSVHGILQARILQWVAMSFSKGSSRSRESSLGLPHCRQMLYCPSYPGSPIYTLAWMVSKRCSKYEDLGTSLVVQWPGIHIPSVGGLNLIPAWGAGSHKLQLDPTCHN